ncbi:TIR domain-containing protein [Pontixanthobacter sp. CEM42]|uniref:TIR domain-containing protein n=1 Tax=Pontixanthobacter sp. CEM42 TaxID=2792077 RepID=UPI001AE01447|nr:TIR domain-containing protein [Pontixanthobacter sp. CEM42]
MSEAISAGGEKRSIFLSYSRDDRDAVLPIIEALEQNGYSVWWDGLLKGGDRFSHVTEKALETADTVLVIWTAISINSHWVRDEATSGRDRGRLLSVSLDGTSPPLGFRQIQYVDLSGGGPVPDRPAFGEVLGALSEAEAKAGTRLTFSSVSDGEKGISRRSLMIAGGAGLLAAGGGFAAWQSGMFVGSGRPNSIAVMTFENLSNNPDQDYFSAGLAEELRSILSLNRQLSVAAQTSSDKFSDGSETASAIASALDVAHVLEGSVRRAGDQLRVAVRLIDGKTDLDVWSDVFERELDDVLAVQSEIATTVVDSLVANFSETDSAGTIRVGGTENPDALDAYLLGVDLYARSDAREETDREALAALDEAVAIDRSYAAAHAARSRVLTSIGNRHATGSELRGYYDRSMEAARTAIDLAPELAEGYAALGYVLANGELDIAGALSPYDQSFELGYGNAWILRGYTLFASFIGAFEKGRSAIARAERLDPLNAPVFRAEAVLEFAARDYDRASTAARRALALSAETSIVNRILGDIARFDGRIDEARAFYDAEPNILSKLTGLAILEAQEGNADLAQDMFDNLVQQFGDNSLYQQAQIFAQWGRSQDALDTLERAYAIGDSGLVTSRSDQNLDPVRQTSEFKALQKRLGFD